MNLNISKKTLWRIICLLLAAALVVSLCCCGKNSEETPEKDGEVRESAAPHQTFELSDTPVYKEESVYVNLNPDGSVSGISVTDRIHTDLPQIRIEDVTNLSDVSDVKTFIEPVYEDDRMYWDMESTDLYYNGTTEAEPPVNVGITYYLDGEEISYADLAGKSGNVKIDIKVENTLTKSVSIGGKAETITCPMLFVGGMILPEESFENVKTENAAILGDGSHKLVFFVGIPGMNDSLALDSLSMPLLGDAITKTEYSVSADVESFSISNMMFAAVPFSSVFALGGEGALDGVEGLKTALADIEGLLNAFSSLDVSELMQMLYGGAAQAEKLISAVGEASELYNENRGLLELMDKYVTSENIALLERLVTELQSLDTGNIEKILGSTEFSYLMNLLSRFDSNVSQLSGISRDAMQLMGVVNSLQNDLADAEVKKSVDNLPETVSRLQNLVNVLKDSREMIDSFESLLDSETMESIMNITEKYADLSALTEVQAEHLAMRMKEWLAFGQEYDIFTTRTQKATSSVIFIYKTEAIG